MTGKQKLLIGSIASIGLAGVMGLTAVSAASSTPGTSLASKIAMAFHLNQADVQKVIDQNRSDNQAAREADYEARLDKAVAAGTITAAQKAQILAKQTEIKDTLEANKDKDAATRRAAMKTEMDSVKQWATDNKIPLNLLGPIGRHPGMGMPAGPPPTNN